MTRTSISGKGAPETASSMSTSRGASRSLAEYALLLRNVLTSSWLRERDKAFCRSSVLVCRFLNLKKLAVFFLNAFGCLGVSFTGQVTVQTFTTANHNLLHCMLSQTFKSEARLHLPATAGMKLSSGLSLWQADTHSNTTETCGRWPSSLRLHAFGFLTKNHCVMQLSWNQTNVYIFQKHNRSNEIHKIKSWLTPHESSLDSGISSCYQQRKVVALVLEDSKQTMSLIGNVAFQKKPTFWHWVVMDERQLKKEEIRYDC